MSFYLGHKSIEIMYNICISMGEHLSYDMAKAWFQLFKEGNSNLKDQPHSQRLSVTDSKLGND